MIRPFVVIGISVLITTAVVLLCGSFAGFFIAGMAVLMLAALAIFLKIRIKPYIVTVLAAISVSAALCGLNMYFRYEPALGSYGKTVIFSGKVLSLENASSGRKLTVRSAGGDIPAGTETEVYSYGFPEIEKNSEVTLKVKIYDDGKRNLSRLVSAVKNGKFVLKGSLSEVLEVGGTKNDVFSAISDLRERLHKNILDLTTAEEGGIIAEMTLGIRSGSGEIYDDFRDSGIAHLLAMSGFHLSITAGALYFLLSALGAGGRKGALIVIIFTLFYIFLTGAEVGTLRAGIMLIVSCLAASFGYGSEKFNNMGIALTAILLISPISVFSASLYLSFAAYMGIVLLAEKMRGALMTKTYKLKLDKVRSAVFGVISVTVSATLFTLPITVLLFERVTLYSVPANLLSAPFVPILVVSGNIAEALSLLPVRLPAQIFAYLSEGAAAVIRFISKLFASLSGAKIYIGYGFVKIWIISFAIIFALMLLLRKKPERFVYAGIISLTVLLGGALSYGIAMRGVTRVNVTALESSLCLNITNGKDSVSLCGDGTKFDAVSFSREAEGENACGSAVFFSGARETAEFLRESDIKELFVTREAAADETVIAFAGERKLNRIKNGAEIEKGAITVRVLCEGACFIESEEIKILYLFRKCDILDIDVGYTDADIVVFDGVLPYNYERLRCKCAVYRDVYGVDYLETEDISLMTGDKTCFYLRNGAFKRG